MHAGLASGGACFRAIAELRSATWPPRADVCSEGSVLAAEWIGASDAAAWVRATQPVQHLDARAMLIAQARLSRRMWSCGRCIGIASRSAWTRGGFKKSLPNA
jgi:hypothetical protein